MLYCKNKNETLAAKDPKQGFEELLAASLQSGGPTVWGPTVSELSILGHGIRSLAGSLQTGGLQTRATRFRTGSVLTRLGVYSWRPTVWGSTVSGYQIWSWTRQIIEILH